MAMKKAAPKKAAPKKGDEPVRVGKRQQQATEMDFAKTYKKKQSTGKDQPVRAGTRTLPAGEADFQKAWKKADQRKNPSVGNQSPRVKNFKKPVTKTNSFGEQTMSKKEYNSRSGDLSGYGFNTVGRTLQRSYDQSKRSNKKAAAAQAQSSRVNRAEGASRIKVGKTKK